MQTASSHVRGMQAGRWLRRRAVRPRRSQPWLWFAPVLVLLLAVTLYPTALVIWISFQKTQYYALAGFVGLSNYTAVLGSARFLQLSTNSLLYVTSALAIVLPLGLARSEERRVGKECRSR